MSSNAARFAFIQLATAAAFSLLAAESSPRPAQESAAVLPRVAVSSAKLTSESRRDAFRNVAGTVPAAPPSDPIAQSPAPDPGADLSRPWQQRLRRIEQREVTRGVVLEARRIIRTHHTDPFGTEVPFAVDGVSYVARIEQHYHPPGGDKKPWGHHAGVSVFVPR